MKIELLRYIEHECWIVKAEIAFPEELSEVISILQIAKTKKRIYAEDIINEKSGLLPGRPMVMGQRLLNHVSRMRYLEEGSKGEFSLTNRGEAALSEGRVFLSEQDAWKIWFSSDPIFPDEVIYVERVKDQNTWTEPDTEGIPDKISSLEGQRIELFFQNKSTGSEIEIIRIDKNGQRADNNSGLTLKISVEGSSPRGVIERTTGRKKRPNKKQVDIPEGTTSDSIFRDLIGGIPGAEGFDWSKKSLPLYWNPVTTSSPEMDELSEQERKTHTKTVAVPEPAIAGLGVFQKTFLEVPIHPADSEVAKKWAEWEFWNDLVGFPWPDSIKTKGEQFIAKHELGYEFGREWQISSLMDQIGHIKEELGTIHQTSRPEEAQTKFRVASEKLLRYYAVLDLGGAE